jgi:hypothetical protein
MMETALSCYLANLEDDNTVSVHHPVMFTDRSPHQLIHPTNSEAITPRRVDIIIQEVDESYYLLLQNFYLTRFFCGLCDAATTGPEA